MRGGAYNLRHVSLLLFLAVLSCAGVGFSSWTIGNVSDSTNIDATVADFDGLFLQDFVTTDSLDGFTIGKTGLSSSPTAGIYDDGVITYEADIVVSHTFTIFKTDAYGTSEGLYYFYDTSSTDGVLSEVSLNISLAFSNFDLSEYVTAVSAVEVTYRYASGSLTVSGSNISNYAGFGTLASSSKTVTSLLGLKPLSNYAFTEIETISLTTSFHVDFGGFDAISSNYDSIKSMVVTSEVSLP